MRKHFLLLMLTALLPLAGWAAVTSGPGANTVFTFTWTHDGDSKTAVIKGFVNGAEKVAITIPATVAFPETDGAAPTTFNVIGIDENAFKDETDITSVDFAASSNLTTIGAGAFSGCTGMTSVDFTNATKLETIDANAFKSTKIKALDLSKTKVATVNNLLGTTFGASPVANNTLTTVKLPKTVTSIVGSAFANCTALNDLSFEAATDPVTIGESAFRGTALTELDLSSTKIAEINNLFGTTADIKNSTLETVKFPATVANISGTAFLNCNKLKTLTFTGSAAGFTIAAGALAGTIVEVLDLESTKIAVINNLFGTKIAAPAVANTTLQTVKLPNTWTTIATKAFENCTALTTVSLKPATGDAVDGQAIQTLAFNGAPLTNGLNFTGTTVSVIPANLLMDGTNVNKNTTLQTVTLNATIAALNASFANCEALATVNIPEASTLIALEANEFKGDKALATINTSKIQTFGASAFEGCAALTSINLAACTALSEATFKDAGLTIVTIPKTVTDIPDNCFNGCEKLETVTFGHGDTDPFNHIGEYAFAYTKIAAIIIPKTLPLNVADGIESKAFGGCEQLKSFTFKPEAAPTATVISVNAFLGCSGVMFYTTDDYMSDADVTGANQPKNITYVTSATPAVVTSFTTTKFANGENKYYIKWKGTNDIKIKKNEAKVYDAYLDDEWNTLNMIQFKSSGGYVYIKAGQVALIITEKEDLSYEANDANKHTSWVRFDAADDNDQVLKILAADQSRLDLEEAAPAGSSIYGWVNSANTKKTGFQKITSGKTFKAGTLYVYAKEEPAAAPGLNVVWLDENGFVEENTTAISDIIAEPAQENGEMFNLQGIRVNGAAQKGIYIKNGKKFVVK